MSDPQADLRSLAVSRDSRTVPALRLPRRWLSRVVVPAVLVAGFSALLLWASWDRIVPATPVKVVPVQVQSGTVETAGQELFKANGWIEPRPMPIEVPVQTEGMYQVKEVLVTPGETVKGGQLLVLLDAARAALDLESAEKRALKRQAGVQAAKAEVKKAEVAARNAKVFVDLAKAEGQADVNALMAELNRAEAVLKAGEFAVGVELGLLESKAVTSEVKLRQAQQARDVARADRDATVAKLEKAKTGADVRVKQAELAAASAAADQASQAAKAEEAVQDAADAAIDVRRAKLEIDRTRITAPCDGVVMALNIRVGSVVGGKATYIEHKDAVVVLYDPKKLQVRVEVPVAKFALVRSGQPAEIELDDVLPGVKLAGTVLRDTHQANVARNSVPVKVALPDNAPPQLRPDMIASVKFRALAEAGKPKTETARRLTIPRRLLIADGEQSRVWVVDAVRGTADLRLVELAPGEKDRQGASVEVVGGLNPTDKLIATGREGLAHGQRVKVVGEDR